MYEYRLCDHHPQGSPNSQGAFALCRVIKRNEAKDKRVGSSSSSVEFPLTMNSGEISTQATDQNRESRCSEPVFMENDTSNTGISQDQILESFRLHPQLQSDDFSQHEHPNSICAWQLDGHGEFSMCSSSSNFTNEVETADDLRHLGYMSPYSGLGYYAGFTGNDAVPYQESEPWEQAPICRQASGDGSLGEYGGLWTQEDNMVIVI